MAKRSDQADALVLEGASPADVDRVLYDYGFPMGPFQMWDLVGLDVLRDDPEKNVRGEMVRLGRLCQKKDGGYYDYDAQRNPTLSPVAMEIIESIAGERGVKQSEQPKIGRDHD